MQELLLEKRRKDFTAGWSRGWYQGKRQTSYKGDPIADYITKEKEQQKKNSDH